MVRWVVGIAALSLMTLFSFAQEDPVKEEEKKETASVEKKALPDAEKKDPRQDMKRRWTKKTKPGSPKARKVTPGRNRSRSSSDGIIGMEEEEFDEEDLPVDEGKSS